jgi:sialic acid synthase SpsE/quercetin dioxygenase-like cupin family protein
MTMTRQQSSDIFKDLFVFEMANNHQGSVEHGRKIIRQLRAATEGMPFRFAVKLQYRNLDTFIHPAYRDRQDIKYVKRFRDTELREDQLLQLKEAIVEAGFIPMCTPFDEDSVDWATRHGFHVLKIASCSLTDWPLLERIGQTKLPVIASTAGATLDDIDKIVGFFKNRYRPLALMHCVGEYPTPRERLQLGQIGLLRQRYPDIPIGYSTHEPPTETEAVKMAMALGASIFEKHVGVGDLNAYSADPAQVRSWLESARDTRTMLGLTGERVPVTEHEITTLNALRRGVFAKHELAAGECVSEANTFLAIPAQPGQLLANDLSKYVCQTLQVRVEPGAPLLLRHLDVQDNRGRVLDILKKVTALLRTAHTTVPDGASCELSHHFGIDRFEEQGATIISVVNREYCKKLIALLPGQDHPTHSHRKKEETFHVLHGSMDLDLNGEQRHVKAGEMVTVERGSKHAFSTQVGVVFEELSTTHYPNDSFYDDERVQSNPKRKTPLVFRGHWLTEELW